MENPPPICEGYDCVQGGIEEAVSSDVSYFTSGGGFSGMQTRPSYQEAVVEEYLSSSVELPPSSYYNRSGRAYPDVSALGNNIMCYVNGERSPEGGTSASAPLFAGVLAILNSRLLELGRKPLGFVNPLLYKMAAEFPEAFNDVVDGDNACTEAGCTTDCKGFYASAGWDPVTGLGTPNVEKMLEYVTKLQSRSSPEQVATL